MNYSYKKEVLKLSMRPLKEIQFYNLFSQVDDYQIFWKWNILLILTKQVFNRSLTNNYSWLPKGISNSILNINATGRWSILVAIRWDGEFLVQIHKSIIDSELFQQFLCILNYVLNFTMKTNSQTIVLNIDNASTNVSERTKMVLSKMNCWVNFLPPYCPHLAPVELFFQDF